MTSPPPNLTITRKLKWHGMLCPACLTDQSLEVKFTGTAKITDQGSEDSGDHEWGEDSICQCTACRFSGPVIAFHAGNMGDDLRFSVYSPDRDPELGEIEEDDEDLCQIDEVPDFEIETTVEAEGTVVKLLRTVGDWTLVLMSAGPTTPEAAANAASLMRERIAPLSV